MKYFTKKMTLDEVKAAYRAAAMRLHPDRGGSTEAMQQLNIEFEVAFAIAQKFEKADPTYTKRQPKTAESAGSYRRQFYTVNGWQGERYNSNLSTKDIAQLIREYVKTAYPTYRFSITSNIRHITVSLMEYPVELTNDTMMRNYCRAKVRTQPVYIPSKNKYVNANKISEADKEEWIAYRLETANQRKDFYESDTWLNPVVFAVLKDVQDFMNSYNYDDSDSMTDYFNVNFYDSLQIGKDGKPAKFVERTARISPKKEKAVKRLTA